MAASPSVASSAFSSTRQIWRFSLLCGAFALLWAVGSIYGLGRDSTLDSVLCQQLASASAWGLRLIGWHATSSVAQSNLLLLNEQPTVLVGPPCNGLVLYVLLAGFVLAYPGPSQRRLWFIPLGIAVLWLLNVVRIMALALNQRYSPETFDFDHHYGFNAIAYSVLGGLWLLWTRQSASTAAEAEPARAISSQPRTLTWSWLTARTLSGLLLLIALVLINIFHTQIIAGLSAGWFALLAAGPAWLHRLPGASNAPAGVSNLPLPVGMAYVGLFLAISLLVLYLLLPASSWRLVWRGYTGAVLLYALILAAGRFGVGPEAYRIGRMLLDFLASLLPVAGLLVLLWRPAPAAAPAELAAS